MSGAPRNWEVMVLGAGPAGMAAAIEAGPPALLLDDQPAPGGQVFRAPPPGLRRAATPDSRAGDRLRAALAASGATHLPQRQVWLAEPGFRLHAIGPDGPEVHEAPKLILATGAVERIIPVPGWTLPGVIGLAAATVLLKAQGVLPGRRVVVAGTGPLLYAVASAILKGGGTVAAVVDAARAADWRGALPAMLAQPALLARGAAWRARLAAARVPVLHGHAVTALHGAEALTEVEVAPVGGGGARRIAADACTLGHGLVPDTGITRLLGAKHVFAAESGGWIATTDERLATSIPGLFVAGDAAGIAGAAAAESRGRRAARAALGRPVPPPSRAERFGAAMALLMRPPDSLAAAIPPDTIICRCEGITRAAVDAAIEAGARDANQAKNWTRCGMGPCQARLCGEALAELVALRRGGREAAGMLTGRAPLRPVPYDLLIGAFDYDELSLPAPAPS
jgi:thioredoxin reductase/bacterioferritin-associated ferredoxin